MSLARPQQFPHNIGARPTENIGARVLPVTLVFTASITSISDDLVLENTNGMISAVQTVYIDNSQNQALFVLKLKDSGQQIVVPPYSQGYWPVICWQSVSYTAISYFACSVNVSFLNTAVKQCCWSTNGGAALGTPFMYSSLRSNAAVNIAIPFITGRQIYITYINCTGSPSSGAILSSVYMNHIYSAGSDVTPYWEMCAAANEPPQSLTMNFTPPWQGVPNQSPILAFAAMGVGSTQAAVIAGFYI